MQLGIFPMVVPAVDIQPVDAHRSGFRFEQSAEDTAERAFSTAGFTDDAETFSFLQRQAYAAQHLLALAAEKSPLVLLAEGNSYVRGCQNGTLHAALPSRGVLPACMAARKRDMTALC